MATSIRYNQTGDGDKVLSISGSQIARKINVGNNWHWLRLSVRLQLTNSMAVDSAINIVGPQLAIGLCSGTSSLYGDVNTTYFMGIDTDSSKTFVGNYTGIRYYTLTSGSHFITKVNTTRTVYSDINRYQITMPREDGVAPANQSRRHQFIDFIKPTVDPGMGTIVFFRDDNAGAGTDITTSSFYSKVLENTASFLAPYTTYTTSSFLIPFSESVYGNLDTVNINWGNQYGLEISDVVVYRFA